MAGALRLQEVVLFHHADDAVAVVFLVACECVTFFRSLSRRSRVYRYEKLFW